MTRLVDQVSEVLLQKGAWSLVPTLNSNRDSLIRAKSQL